MRTRGEDSSPRWTPRSTSQRGCCSACRGRSSRRRVRPPMNSAGTRPLSASEIAALTGGRLVGPGTVTVAGIAPLERAGPGDLSFLASPRYVPYFERTSASVVLVAPALEAAAGGPETRIIVPEPYAALLVVLPVLYPQAVWEAGVHPTAVVGRATTWQEPVAIGPHASLRPGGQCGRHRDRIGHEDRQSRAHRAQRADRRPLPHHGAGRYCGELPGGGRRDHRGTDGHLGSPHDRAWRPAARTVGSDLRRSCRRDVVRLSCATAPRVSPRAGGHVPTRQNRGRARSSRKAGDQ